tara:strand:- start:1037 stop:1357 length:321 start_codon:yes stop_codon:yes gene_type:complete
MIYIPKSILKKLKLRKEEEVKKIESEVEEARAIENTRRFEKSLEIVDKIGKEIGEMRNWDPYCNNPKTYNPFPMHILNCNKQQLIQLLIHCYGTAKLLKKRLDGKS